jgi:hypothetical protein
VGGLSVGLSSGVSIAAVGGTGGAAGVGNQSGSSGTARIGGDGGVVTATLGGGGQPGDEGSPGVLARSIGILINSMGVGRQKSKEFSSPISNTAQLTSNARPGLFS